MSRYRASKLWGKPAGKGWDTVVILRWAGWPRVGGAALVGVVLALAFPPFGLWPLAFVAVAGLSLLVRGAGARRAAVIGGVFGVAFIAVLCRWLNVIGWDAVLGLALLEGAFYAPLGVALAWTARRPAWPLWHACAWVLAEALRARYPLGGLPWGKLAFSQVDSPLAGIASLGGSPLVSFAAAGVGAALAALALAAARPRAPARRLRPVAGAAATAAAVLGLGAAIPLPTSATDGTVTAAAVQGNVPRLGFDISAQRDAVLANHLEATRGLAADVAAGRVAQPEIVIWPENASDDDPFTDPVLAARIGAAVDQVGAPTLVGTVLDVGPENVTNTGIVWNPGTGPAQTYSKRQLVPFGEYIPARDVLTGLIGRLALVPRDFLPGDRPGVLDMGGVIVGDVICFEVAYDDAVLDVVRGGARLLVVQTNNATYGRTGQPEQQLAISRLRTIEHGRAMVVAATSGISALIAPDGTVLAQTEEFTQDVLVAELPLRDGRTIATRVGAWPEAALCLLALVSIVIFRPRRTPRPGRGQAATVGGEQNPDATSDANPGHPRAEVS